MSKLQYIEVAPTAPLPATSRQTYTYHLDSAEPISIGSIVTIPFGPRQIQGVVLAIPSKRPPFPTKPATLKDTPPLTVQQMNIAQTIADTMHGGLGFTLRLFLAPTGKYASPAEPAMSYTAHKLPATTKNILTILTKKPAAIITKEQHQRHHILAQIAYHYANQDQQVAIIVPEITMIEPIMQELAAYLPAATYAALYAGRGTKTSRHIWHQVKHNHLKIIVGTQKTLCLPWQKLGLIMIEQEQYPTHKLWDQYPRLPNRYLAGIVAQEHHSQLLYATDFPSLWLRQAIKSNSVAPIIQDGLHPAITMEASQFSDRRAKNLLPQTFVYRLKAWAKQDKTIFLLCNKRGAWQIAACRACHTASRCHDCGATLLIQAKPGKIKGKAAYQLTCRSCQKTQKIPEVCTHCKKGKLQFIRPGIETIELAVRALLPRQSIIRLDAGTIRGQKTENIQKKLNKANIVIGTSAALTHLTGIQLDRIAWLFPEDTLMFPDVRSSERGWYLLSRLTALLPPKGAVVAVTRQEHLIKDIFAAGDDQFFAKELVSRQRLFYPPATDMVRLTFTAASASAALNLAAASRQKLAAATPANTKIIIRGPFGSAELEKTKDSHLLLFGDLTDLQPLYKKLPLSAVDYLPERIM